VRAPLLLRQRVPMNARVLTLAEARVLAAAGSRWVMVRGAVVQQRAEVPAPVWDTGWWRVGCDADELLVSAEDAQALIQEQNKTKRKRQ